MLRFSLIILLIGAVNCLEEKYKLCATEAISETTCNSLTRGSSRVSCLRVTDNAECAIRMSESTADFGVFDAEEMLLAYQFYPEKLKVLSQLRHIDRVSEDYEFQSVVVVPSTYDGRNGLASLKNVGLCHPGFSKSQHWNDRILKYFEKRVYEGICHYWNVTAAEMEIINLREYFGSACRPGEWVADEKEDKKLKSLYPELCELCDNKESCRYNTDAHNGHFGALECLTSGRGKVAYVAYEYVRQYFRLTNDTSLPSASALATDFQFLCEDGTTRPLTSFDPCSWIRQPWSAVVARTEKATEILEGLKVWLTDDSHAVSSIDWTGVLRTILASDTKPNHYPQSLALRRYLTEGRSVIVPKNNNPCGKSIRWCTVNEHEKHKCDWIAKEAIIGLDIVPNIECLSANSTLECLKNIANENADIITIDSNYGYIARQVFDLTTIMYAETDSDRNSEVIAVIRDAASSDVTSWKSLKKRTACFPEYGGIAWLSFLNVARTAKIISKSCDYPRIVSEFFSGGACTPGLLDPDHSTKLADLRISAILCKLCPTEPEAASCSANENNAFYGDKGALKCLSTGNGDVAFVERKNLRGFIDGKRIDPNDYRVLCKNGSLATYTGFNVDESCALSVTVDSEVISRKESPEKYSGRVLPEDVTLALLKLENWLGYRPDARRPIRIYDSFRGNSNLLFKDSTVGLVSSSSELKSVRAYQELFRHVETCSGVENIVANFFTTFVAFSLIVLRFL